MEISVVLKVLQTAAIAAVQGSSIPGLAIQAVDQTLDPIPGDGKWIEFVHIPNNGSDRYWDGNKVLQGIFRIILHWPVNKSAGYAPIRYIEELAKSFDKDALTAEGVEIYQNPEFTGSVPTGNDIIYPLSLAYRSFR